ncbi:hypothetical protein ACRALDRAFT_2029116 [Sodiomyces alcalophilus JCM 7366]|uniref:uncharacterized protein n=1 Tax=Sodiomyces alcalophilus JCM 7366 TaxID=591952 RepID=UPI0039B5422E
MVVCKFWEAGNCRYGQNCRFEHPNRNQTGNRFAAFGGTGGGAFGGTSSNAQSPYTISKETIQKDLTNELPQWILSAYSGGRDTPEQLFGGPIREQSFEEMKLHHVLAEAAGNPQQAITQAQQLWQQAQQQIQTTLGNLDGAIEFIRAAEHKHPNRYDICKQNTPAGGSTGAFSKGRTQTTSAFSQPNPFQSGSAAGASTANPFSTNTQTSSPFGAGTSTTGAFGQPSTTASGFGQPSALGQKPSPFGAPAFGQPSQPATAFAKPAENTPFSAASQSKPAFGQSGFGQPAFGQSGFGKPAQGASPFGQAQAGQTGAGGSAFGQPSALGSQPKGFGAPAFGQPAQPAQPSAFGQASALGQKPNPFAGGSTGPSPFASAGPTATANTTSPFGAPAQPSAAPNPFGQPAQPSTASPFATAAQPATGASNPFASQTTTTQPAQANPFQQATQKASPFGQPSSGTSMAPNPFNSNAPAAAPTAAAAASSGGNNPYPPGSAKKHPDVSTYATKNMSGQLAQWKGKAVTYKDGVPGIREFDGTWARIWFPDGPPAYYKDTELPAEEYDEKSKAQWRTFEQTGKFEGGMPELPPMREVCLWDF